MFTPKTKYDLLCAFSCRAVVSIKVDGRYVKGVICKLEHEDGSGNSFSSTILTDSGVVSGYIGRFN
jgi:hypothetical protein